MSLSPLHLMRNFNSYMSGEVTIDPSAAIAPGVMLQADPNSQIIIAAGACIGMGTVLHARNGILEIEAGATIGAGVLLIGRGKIGANACIGSATTILNCSIAPEQVVAPNSLLGDTSRKVETAIDSTTTSSLMPEVTQPSSQAKPDEQIQTAAQLADNNGFLADSAVDSKAASALTPEVTQPSSQPKSDEEIQTQAQSANNNGAQVVYGKAALHQLMSTLFPHRQALNPLPPEGSAGSQSP
ncbi:MAG TPA: transferase [Cyanobacteria bacterium UBA11049]|nr:transferase [Cyanobacteria bacterium UBA11049]